MTVPTDRVSSHRVIRRVKPAVTTSLLRRAGVPEPASGRVHDIRPADVGWQYVGFTEHRLAPGDGFERPPDDREVSVVVMEGAISVDAAGEHYTSLGSRSSPLEGPPAPVLLLASGSSLAVRSELEATVIIADAPAAADSWTRLIEASEIRVETRGSGSTERRVHHLLPPSAEAGRLILFEVVTPGGNWSSYPPHKHDVEIRRARPTSRSSTTTASTAPRDGPSPASTQRTGRSTSRSRHVTGTSSSCPGATTPWQPHRATMPTT